MEAALEFIQTNSYVHFILIGFVIGMVARILMPGPDPMGIIKTTLLGIAGSLLSGFLVNKYEVALPLGEPWGQYLASVVGAFVLLAIFKFVRNIG